MMSTHHYYYTSTSTTIRHHTLIEKRLLQLLPIKKIKRESERRLEHLPGQMDCSVKQLLVIASNSKLNFRVLCMPAGRQHALVCFGKNEKKYRDFTFGVQKQESKHKKTILEAGTRKESKGKEREGGATRQV